MLFRRLFLAIRSRNAFIKRIISVSVSRLGTFGDLMLTIIIHIIYLGITSALIFGGGEGGFLNIFIK